MDCASTRRESHKIIRENTYIDRQTDTHNQKNRMANPVKKAWISRRLEILSDNSNEQCASVKLRQNQFFSHALGERTI